MASETVGDGGLSKDEDWRLAFDMRRPLPEVIEEKIRNLIQRGVLGPGQRLPTEPTLAERLGVARSSVRTALQRLELHGVLEVKRGRGWYVRADSAGNLDDDLLDRIGGRRFQVPEIMEVRIALETLAASLAAARAHPSKLDHLAKLSAEYQNTDVNDKEAMLRTDEAFHAFLVEASGNRFLTALYEMLVPDLREWRLNSYTSEVHLRSANDHNQIIMFLRRHDQVGSRAAVTTHLLGLYQEVLSEQLQEPAEASADLSTFVGVEDEPIWEDRH
jgi:GntR family transcriptional regulator, transcriptional repressor for pyruvate dehydrogenase complex